MSKGAVAKSGGGGNSAMVGNYLTKEEGSQMIHSVFSSIASMYNKGIEVINTIPGQIQTGTLALATAVGAKLQSIGDAVKGQGGDQQQSDYTSVLKAHYEMLEKLRKQDIVKYKKLIELCKLIKDQPASLIYTKIANFYSIPVKTPTPTPG